MLAENKKVCDICKKEIQNGGINNVNLEFSQNLKFNDVTYDICDDCGEIFAEAVDEAKFFIENILAD